MKKFKQEAPGATIYASENIDVSMKEMLLKKNKRNMLKILAENILAGMAWNG